MVPKRSGQPRERLGLRRERIGGPAVDQVPAVADAFTEPIRLHQHVGVIGREDPAGRKRIEGGDGAGCPHPVLQLEHLRGELDVRERTAAQLEVELRVLTGRDPLAFDARLHPTNLEQFVRR